MGEESEYVAKLLVAVKRHSDSFRNQATDQQRWCTIVADTLGDGVCPRCILRALGHQDVAAYVASPPSVARLVHAFRTAADAAKVSAAAEPGESSGTVQITEQPVAEGEGPAPHGSGAPVAGTNDADPTSVSFAAAAAEPQAGASAEDVRATSACGSTTPSVCIICCGALQLLDGPVQSEIGVGEPSAQLLEATAQERVDAPPSSDPAGTSGVGKDAEDKWAHVRLRAIDSASRTEIGHMLNKPVPDLRASRFLDMAQADLNYAFASVGVDVMMPSDTRIRDNVLHARWSSHFPNNALRWWQPKDIIHVKTIISRVIGQHLQQALGRPGADPSTADLVVAISLTHAASKDTLRVLAQDKANCDLRRESNRGPKKGPQTKGVPEAVTVSDRDVDDLNYSIVDQYMAKMPRHIILKLWSWPMHVAAPAAAAARIARPPLLLAGRYLKLKRAMPQCPWFDLKCGQRIGGISLQEYVEEYILPLYQAGDAKFISGGREDADVRMLGTGRPFVMEIYDAMRPGGGHPSAEELRAAEEAMRTSGCGAEVVCLTPCTKSHLDKLKQAEESKEKTYRAVCWGDRALAASELSALEGQHYTVMQETPIRVLHRRAPMSRPKQLWIEKAEHVPGQTHYFSVQAGAYVKEFVHGDFGRCAPSLGSLLGARCEILQLDVLEVHMPDWP